MTLPDQIPDEYLKPHQYQMAQRARLPLLQQQMQQIQAEIVKIPQIQAEIVKIQQIQAEIVKIQAANQSWHEFLSGELQMEPEDSVSPLGKITRTMTPAPEPPPDEAPPHPAEVYLLDLQEEQEKEEKQIAGKKKKG